MSVSRTGTPVVEMGRGIFYPVREGGNIEPMHVVFEREDAESLLADREMCRRISEQADALAEGQVERNARIAELEAEGARLEAEAVRLRKIEAAVKVFLNAPSSFTRAALSAAYVRSLADR